MDFNPLIVICQPRDIPEAIDQNFVQNRSNKYDRLFIQYKPLIEAYQTARKLFLDNKQYTHYINATDDILWTEEAFDRLVSDYKKHFEGMNVVLCADMNTDQESLHYFRGFMTYKQKIPLIEYGRQFVAEDFRFARIDDEEIEYARDNTDGIILCCWSSMPLAIIPRHVIENTTFWTDVEYCNAKNPDKEQIDTRWGCCIDIVFAQECKDKGFPIYTDMNMECFHLKQSNVKNLWLKEYFKVGIKKPSVFFLNAHTNEKRII